MAIQIVELHFAQQPICKYADIKNRAEAVLGEELGAPPHDAKSAFLLFHKNHRVEYREGAVPAQTAILAADSPVEIGKYTAEIQQSWRCPGASKLLSESRHTILVTEMMARLLPASDRLRLFHGVLQAVIEETRPDALVFKHTQQVIDPESYLKAASEKPIFRPGALNVRFFSISNSPGDSVMDVRGLHELGLHDLQCHFRDLEPNDVSRVLFNTAVYIFENGPVISSGQTVSGIEPGSKWVCQFENSLLPPARELLDLNPGSPFAAGGRR